MIKGIDHVVILVDDLDKAVQDYTDLGFRVTPGGEHTGGATHNALVAFRDGSYFELIAFKKDAPNHRWARFKGKREGLIDFALLPTAIEEDIAGARERGAAYEGPTPGGRTRPDGQEVKWQTGLPPQDGMPFLCGDVTPRDLRVPSGDAWEHPNGAQGIATVSVIVNDLDAAAVAYAALLGVEAPSRYDDLSNAFRRARFRVGDAVIALVESTAENPLAPDLADYGEGPFALDLLGAADGEHAPLDVAKAHGVRLAWLPESEAKTRTT